MLYHINEIPLTPTSEKTGNMLSFEAADSKSSVVLSPTEGTPAMRRGSQTFVSFSKLDNLFEIGQNQTSQAAGDPKDEAPPTDCRLRRAEHPETIKTSDNKNSKSRNYAPSKFLITVSTNSPAVRQVTLSSISNMIPLAPELRNASNVEEKPSTIQTDAEL